MKFEVMRNNQAVDPHFINAVCGGADRVCSSINGVCGSVDGICGSLDSFCDFDYMCSIQGHFHFCDYSMPL